MGIKREFEHGTSGYAEFVCFGYKRDDNGKLAIDESDTRIIRQMFEMRANGHSLRAIVNWMSGKAHWNRETISKLLRNEKILTGCFASKSLCGRFVFWEAAQKQGRVGEVPDT